MGATSFLGYQRPDGSFGVRNHLAIISAVGCVNEVTRRIAQEVGGAPITHGQGCAQLPPDLEMTQRVLAGIGSNPNVGAALVVGLGCEGVLPRDLAGEIASTNRPVESVVLQEVGGYTAAVSQGIELARKLKSSLEGQARVEVDLSRLTVGIKCGSSDATSGMVSNPATGLAADRLIATGGSSVFCETTELIGAENLLADRAVTRGVAERLLETIRRLEMEVGRYGMDMRGGQPTPGNMAGGITTIEEKSLGAVCKAGKSSLQGVVEYGERPRGSGLFFMDSPGREIEVFAGLASAGAQVMLFTTGRGAPQGFPIAPVMKISANATTCSFLREIIDVDISGVMARTQTLEEAADSIYRALLAVASGELTRSEVIGYTETMGIWTRGPII